MSESSTALKEFKFLKSNALLALAISLFFIVDAIRLIFFQDGQISGRWIVLINGVEFVFFVFMVYVLFSSLSYFNSVAAKTSWLGNYDDEYLNHTNMTGYKYAFNLAIWMLFVGMFASEIWPEQTSQVSLHAFCKSAFAICGLGYSFPILRALYGENS